ncbi:hypothetical protein ADIARSV_1563 [Arcticibacter svalbardensis MN12-7]|uniref:Uncharacterized protein n=1 Tax=Arcticibacter svalbardensis MN12-7 TaxID=1150600 RepID=R9GUS2_9SPHI|nr:SIR2 family protein [Arcticibacter svalbardensis]EOR95265.1 hypothetical protein ADIARSV_1563 [Arcticibacter svalbardensis MN12-7]
MTTLDVVKEIRELKSQLSYSKNIGFFFGAGTSCALKIPNIEQLTSAIEERLTEPKKALFLIVKNDIKDQHENKPTIEDILNQIRRIREITSDSAKEYVGLSGINAKELDLEICKIIYTVISEKEADADITPTRQFFAWLSLLNRDFSKEIFTTNYDLIIEKSLEASQIPYFDGFVGAFEPFFWQESIDTFVKKNDLTQNWIRLWKIHGSLSWFWKNDDKAKTQKVIRLGRVETIPMGNELVIYPSKDKYDSSKKQPFIAYFDRFKNYLLNGELLFVFTGYSFSDQHINEIIFNCLRQNNRLTILVFCFKDSEVEQLHSLTASYLNINIFGPKKAIINGALGDWEFSKTGLKQAERFDHFWNESNGELMLGDFVSLVNFLVINSGKQDLATTTTTTTDEN